MGSLAPAPTSPRARQETSQVADRTYDQQVLWLPASGPSTTTLDASAPAVTLPRRVGDGRRSFSFHSHQPQLDSGTPKGKLELQLSNAPLSNSALVGYTQWATQTPLTQDVGGADPLPALQAVLINFAGWARLVWTPGNGSSGHLLTFFDGVRL